MNRETSNTRREDRHFVSLMVAAVIVVLANVVAGHLQQTDAPRGAVVVEEVT